MSNPRDLEVSDSATARPEPGAVPPIDVDGELVVFRVLAVGYDYEDRPEGASWTSPSVAGPGPTDSVRLTFGELSDDFVLASRASRAWAPFVLNSMLGGTYAGKSQDELEDIFADLMPDKGEVVAEIAKSGHSHITMSVRRPLRVSVDESRRHRWLRDVDALSDVDKFVAEASEHLDILSARLLAQAPDNLAPSSVAYRRNRAFLFVPNKTPMITDIHMSSSAVAVVSRAKGWETIDWQPVTDVLKNPLDAATSKLLRTASRWLWAAISEANDPLRRFQFAFFGLEVLANKCGRQYEEQLIDTLSAELEGAPLKELFWPSPKDSDSPWRNLVFRFTVMALHLNRDGAAEEVTLFRRLAAARNDLSHGSAGDEAIELLPAGEAVSLLRAYIQRVAQVAVT